MVPLSSGVHLAFGLITLLTRSYNPGVQAHRFGLFRFRSPLLSESRLISFPPGTEMVHFPGLARTRLWIQRAVSAVHAEGFPHSDIPGSKPACGSPRLFAACHVLLRLLAPRHPPYALSSLTIKLAAHVVHPARSFRAPMISIGAKNLFFSKSLGKFRSLVVPNPDPDGSGFGIETARDDIAQGVPRVLASSPFRQVALTKGNLWLDKRPRLIQTLASAYASFGCQRTWVPLPAEPPNAPDGLRPRKASGQ